MLIPSTLPQLHEAPASLVTFSPLEAAGYGHYYEDIILVTRASGQGSGLLQSLLGRNCISIPAMSLKNKQSPEKTLNPTQVPNNVMAPAKAWLLHLKMHFWPCLQFIHRVTGFAESELTSPGRKASGDMVDTHDLPLPFLWTWSLFFPSSPI